MKQVLSMLGFIAVVSVIGANAGSGSAPSNIFTDTIPKKQYIQILTLPLGEWQANIDTLVFVGQSIGRSRTADEADRLQTYYASVLARINRQFRMDSIVVKK